MTPRNETNDGRLTELMTTVLLAALALVLVFVAAAWTRDRLGWRSLRARQPAQARQLLPRPPSPSSGASIVSPASHPPMNTSSAAP